MQWPRHLFQIISGTVQRNDGHIASSQFSPYRLVDTAESLQFFKSKCFPFCTALFGVLKFVFTKVSLYACMRGLFHGVCVHAWTIKSVCMHAWTFPRCMHACIDVSRCMRACVDFSTVYACVHGRLKVYACMHGLFHGVCMHTWTFKGVCTHAWTFSRCMHACMDV